MEELTTEEWKAEKKRKKAQMAAMCAPTAFDKEKVVERLEKLREDNVGRNLNVCDAYDTAIEIVEKGGIA